MNKNRQKHDKIALTVNTKLNTIKMLISEVFTDSHISHYGFLSVNTMLKEYNDMNEAIKYQKALVSTMHKHD